MSEIDASVPKLKLKITIPEIANPESSNNTVTSSATAIVGDANPTQSSSEVSLGSLTGESFAPSDVSVLSPNLENIQEDSTKVKISIGSIKSSHTKDASPPEVATGAGSENTGEISQSLGGENGIQKIPYERNDIAPSVALQNSISSIKQPEKDGVFKNYSSDFEKKSMSFMERFRTISRAPKTRIGFVLGVIIIPAIGVAGLMVVSPEKHSIKAYQANALYFYEQNFGSDVPSLNNGKTDDSITQNPNASVSEASPGENQQNQIPELNREEIKKQKLREYLKNKQ